MCETAYDGEERWCVKMSHHLCRSDYEMERHATEEQLFI